MNVAYTLVERIGKEEGIFRIKESNTLSRQQVWRMFDRIAHRYDLLNHLLSFGQDFAWRKKLIGFLPERNNQIILDLATGTGDVLLSILNRSTKISRAYGVDMARNMLKKGQQKIAEKGLQDQIYLFPADAMALPFALDSFDVVTIAFGIRNVVDVEHTLKEIYRVLKTHGKVLILEFSLPENPFLCKIYLFYFRKILPLIGGVISGDFSAYQYLNRTVEKFPHGAAFLQHLVMAGFTNVRNFPLTFGVATIYTGDKV